MRWGLQLLTSWCVNQKTTLFMHKYGWPENKNMENADKKNAQFYSKNVRIFFPPQNKILRHWPFSIQSIENSNQRSHWRNHNQTNHSQIISGIVGSGRGLKITHILTINPNSVKRNKKKNFLWFLMLIRYVFT